MIGAADECTYGASIAVSLRYLDATHMAVDPTLSPEHNKALFSGVKLLRHDTMAADAPPYFANESEELVRPFLIHRA